MAWPAMMRASEHPYVLCILKVCAPPPRKDFCEELLSAGDYLPESADGFHCRAVWLQIWRVLERHDLAGTLQNVCPPPELVSGWPRMGAMWISGDVGGSAGARSLR